MPDEVIARRYERGVRNFFDLYAPLAWTWRFYDNPRARRRLLATGGLSRAERAHDAKAWAQIEERYAKEA